MILKKLIIFLLYFLLNKFLQQKLSNHQYNFFTGNFDFSDDKQAAC